MYNIDTIGVGSKRELPHKRSAKGDLAKIILILGLGIGISGLQTLSGLATPVTADLSQEIDSPTELLVEAPPEKKSPEGNEIYLYGQSSEPEQVGQAYTVFEVRQQQGVIGAFYMPRSSFDCFYGSIQSDRLAVTIVNSYDQTSYPYSIALDRDSQIAGDRPVMEQMGLAGFYPIAPVSSNDQRILGICKQNYHELISY
ncbi:MAG: hypothetical protein AB4352_00265 [Hormoscilla sp.]